MRVRYSLEISPKYREFPMFRRFFLDFLANRLSVGNIVLGPTDNQYFGDILAEKTEILFLGHTPLPMGYSTMV